MLSKLKCVLDALSAIAPGVFQAEVAAGLAYAVVLFHLNVSDSYKAALLGAALLVFMALQWLYKTAEKPPKG